MTPDPTSLPSSDADTPQPRPRDLERLAMLARQVDLGEFARLLAGLDPAQLEALGQAAQQKAGPRNRPDPNGDFYDFGSTLSPEQQDLRQRVRRFMETEVEPIINAYWARDEFPRDLIPKLRELGLLEALYTETGERAPDAAMLEGLATLEMARVDVSTATFFGVHAGLAMGSVLLGGSDEQRARWLPPMRAMDLIGAFALTEPEVGSGAAGGLTTVCRRDGEAWVLDGEKYWIGNSTFADLIVVWARDAGDGEVKGFVLEAGTPGLSLAKIESKIALRAVENGHIQLAGSRVPESHRLQRATSFRTTADVLRLTRAGVAWQAVGAALGAYEKALAYAGSREQFGKPIASFQLVQNHLVAMLGDVSAMLALCLRLSAMQDAGTMRDEHASLAKVFTAARCREVVARAREVFGGKGILLETHVARMFADTEAIYSYEGTNEINTLVVGRAITGLSAFV